MQTDDYGYVGMCPDDVAVPTRPRVVTVIDEFALADVSSGEYLER